MKLTREFVVGLFTLGAIGILVFITLSLNRIDFFSGRTTYFILFPEVKRLEVGAPVLAAGVPVGSVSAMEYVRVLHEGVDYRVKVTVSVNRDVELYSDAKVEVIAAEVIGDTTVNVDTGKKTPLLAPGSVLHGRQSLDLLSLAGEFSDSLNESLEGLNAILNDPENRTRVKQILSNVERATARADQTFELINQRLDPIFKDWQQTSSNINALLEEARGFSQSVAADVNRASTSFGTASGEVGVAAKSITRDFNAAAEELQSAANQLKAAVETNQQELDATMKAMQAAAQTLHAILEATRKGEGTIGRLLTDTRPFDELRALISSINQALTGRSRPLLGPAPTGSGRRRGAPESELAPGASTPAPAGGAGGDR